MVNRINNIGVKNLDVRLSAADESLIIETDLTEEEKEWIREGEEEYAKGTYIPWSQLREQL